MTSHTRPKPHNLHILCDCTIFGAPKIRIASWAASFLRREGADYQCPVCLTRTRALLIPRFLLPDRIRLKRLI
jgi:hypothetical protein